MSVNIVVLSGRVGQKPILRYTGSGAAVVNLGLAVDDGFGQNKKTHWFDVVAWQKTAEFVSEHVDKGSSLIVSGRLSSREYEKDGVKIKKYEVIADRIEFTGAKPSRPETGQAAEPETEVTDNEESFA